MAQEVERVLGKDEVTGSNPVISSKKTTKYSGFFLFLIQNPVIDKKPKNNGGQKPLKWQSKIFSLQHDFI